MEGRTIMRIIGIDCGLDGAIVTLEGSEIISMVAMPSSKIGTKREIDIEALVEFFSECRDSAVETKFAIVEDPGPHAPSAAGLRSMTYSYAIIKTLLVVNAMNFASVSARTWQKEFFSKPKGMKEKFDTKAAALAAANAIWWNTNWTRTARSSKAFDGFVDAALIAEYGRRLQT